MEPDVFMCIYIYKLYMFALHTRYIHKVFMYHTPWKIKCDEQVIKIAKMT